MTVRSSDSMRYLYSRPMTRDCRQSASYLALATPARAVRTVFANQLMSPLVVFCFYARNSRRVLFHTESLFKEHLLQFMTNDGSKYLFTMI